MNFFEEKGDKLLNFEKKGEKITKSRDLKKFPTSGLKIARFQ